MLEYETKARVRYAETDQMGYLHHRHYATYYELGRIELLRSLDLSYQKMEMEYGIIMPVTSLNMRFVRPARFEDEVTIKVRLPRVPKNYIVFEVDILNEEGKLVNRGAVRLCFVEKERNQMIPAPDFLLEKIMPYFQE
jgi:acyl-CoA thioester hydrolase